MKIYESAEDYLETILILSMQKPQVRSIDIANHMNFSKPSVSVAMKNLRQAGYIQVSSEGFITLLPPGLEIATQIYERHTILTRFLMSLGVDEETAAEDACKLEHHISAKSFAALKEHAEKYHFANTPEVPVS